MIRTRLLTAILFLVALCLVTGTAHAEQGEPPAVHPLLQTLITEPNQPIPPILRSPLGGMQGRKKIGQQDALDLHLRTTASRETLESLGLVVRTLNGGRATVTALPSHLAALSQRPDIQSISLPRRVYPNLSSSTPDIGIEYLRSESGGTFSGATGSGVIVGVVDSGIDVDHPNFMDASGNTRILYAYDQNTSTECDNADIDAGTCSIVDESGDWGHGTHVTGIAAGNGAAADEDGNTYSHVGVAPEASIVLVKTDWSTTGIIDGINYIFDIADTLNMPAVVNLSLGSQLGAHDGTDSMEEEIDALVTAQDGRAVVVAAGNARGDSIHAEISAMAGASVLGPDFTIDSYTASSGAGNDAFYAVGYYPETDDLTVHLWSPSGSYVTYGLNTSFLGSPCTASSTADGYILLCNNYRSQLDQSTSDREIIVFIYDDSALSPPAAGTWSMALTGNTVAGDGEVDFWTLSVLGGSSYNAYFSTHVDESETLGIPATSNEAITVGAHLTRTCWEDYLGTSQSYSGSYSLGELAPFSSAGPTRDDRSKPEIAAPGMGIISALAHEVKADLIAAGYGAYVVNDDYLLIQGTSQAAPHVAGAVALLFEEDATYSSDDVKSILRSNAREDDFTAAYEETPSGGFFPFGMTVNYSFGAGKLDLGPWGFNDPYETNDQARNAYDILSGQSLDGYIEHADDIDLFYLSDLVNGDTVDIDLTSLPADYLLRLQQQLAVPGSCGSIFLSSAASSDNSGTTDESISHTASLFTARYIRVASSLGAYDTSTPYDLKAVITRPETTSVHNSTATAQELPDFVEMKIAGTFSSPLETDYYEFQVTGGGTITMAATGRSLQLLDSTGALLTSGMSSLSYSPGLVMPGTTRTYYAVVASGFAIFSSYTLTLTH